MDTLSPDAADGLIKALRGALEESRKHLCAVADTLATYEAALGCFAKTAALQAPLPPLQPVTEPASPPPPGESLH